MQLGEMVDKGTGTKYISNNKTFVLRTIPPDSLTPCTVHLLFHAFMQLFELIIPIELLMC